MVTNRFGSASQMLLAECIPCQYGQHDDCVGECLPPEGMIGGSRCSCTGDCHERHPWTDADLARIEDQPDPDMAGAINTAIAASKTDSDERKLTDGD